MALEVPEEAIGLDQKIKEHLDWQEQCGWHHDWPEVLPAFRAVLALHARKSIWMDDDKDWPACSSCGTHYERPVHWPCQTLRDIAAALGVDGKD